MGPNHRAIERELTARQRREEEAREVELATERHRAMAAIDVWNAELAAGKTPFFSPTIGAALLTRHHWLHVVCPACSVAAAIDLTMKRRDPALTIAQVLPSLALPALSTEPAGAEAAAVVGDIRHRQSAMRHPVPRLEPKVLYVSVVRVSGG